MIRENLDSITQIIELLRGLRVTAVHWHSLTPGDLIFVKSVKLFSHALSTSQRDTFDHLSPFKYFATVIAMSDTRISYIIFGGRIITEEQQLSNKQMYFKVK